VVSVVTKSGTKDFQVSGYYSKRDEQFNGSNFLNNRNNIVKPRYRHNTYYYNISGPAYIPGKFNSKKEALSKNLTGALILRARCTKSTNGRCGICRALSSEQWC